MMPCLRIIICHSAICRTMVKLLVDTDLILMFFNSVIVPSLVYGCVVYYGFLAQELKKSRLDKARKIYCKILRLEGQWKVCMRTMLWSFPIGLWKILFIPCFLMMSSCLEGDVAVPTVPLELVGSGAVWFRPQSDC